MRELAVVIARELQEWRRVFVAALAFGCLAALGPLIPELGDIDLLSLGFAVLFGLAVALLAGGGFIGRELTERRMGFYFFRPLSDGAIWGGKMLAAFFLAFFSSMLVLVPPTFVGGGLLELFGEKRGLFEESAQRGIGNLVPMIVIVVLLANSIQLTFRSRSRWALLDLAAMLGIAVLLSVAIYPLTQAGAMRLSRLLIVIFVLLSLLTLAIAGYVGIHRGRTDLRQVHKYHALALWSVLGLGGILLIAFSIWVRSAGPQDLDTAYVTAAAPTGSWITVTGISHYRGDFQTTLLINAGTGERLRLPGGPFNADTVAISHDGRRAIWLEPIELKSSRGRVVVATLGRKPRTQPTTIFASSHDHRAISPDGSQLALFSEGVLTAVDIESERTLASARIPPSERAHVSGNRRMFFAGPNLIRLYARTTETTLKIYEFDIQKKKLEQTGSIDAGERFDYSVSPAGTLALRLFDKRDVQLHDARTGRIVTVLVKGKSLQSMGFLADGRFVVAGITGDQAELSVFSPAGALEKTIELGPAATVRLGGQPEQGTLIVATSPQRAGSPDYQKSLTVSLVDLESGKARQVASQIMPLTYLFGPPWLYMGQLPVPGSVATKLFTTPDQQLVYLDPTTGERRVIAGHPIHFKQG